MGVDLVVTCQSRQEHMSRERKGKRTESVKRRSWRTSNGASMRHPPDSDMELVRVAHGARPREATTAPGVYPGAATIAPTARTGGAWFSSATIL